MKYKVILSNLFISASQKCNLDCRVCQCGDATNDEMTRPVAEWVFSDIIKTRDFGFMDGEVNLAPNAIRLINEVMKEKGVVHESFGGYLNGTVYNKECMSQLTDIMSRSTNKNSPSYWQVSLDEWHLKAAKKIMTTKDYSKSLKKLLTHPLVALRTASSGIIYNEGRAKNTEDTYGVNKIEPNPEFYTPYCYINEKENPNRIFASAMTINCFGDAVVEGDYNTQKETSYGNVVRDQGVANILLNSDKVRRFSVLDEYCDAHNKMYDAEIERRKSSCLTKDFEKQRYDKLYKEFSSFI